METLITIGIIIYWVPIYLYLIVWSIKIRWHVRKNNIESLDSTFPMVYKKGRLTDFQILGEVLTYTMATFCGVFTFLALPRNTITKPLLPDD